MSQLSSQTSTHSSLNPLKQPTDWLYALWKFSRPHTIAGTSLSVLALYLIALAMTGSGLSSQNLGQLLGTWISCLCGNVYIVGLNQLEDVEIDQINKPHLPIAAGEFSRQQAKLIIALTGILALLLAGCLGEWLFLMVSISLAIGTAYSLPPIRLKRFPFWAALCIFSVRGAVVNLGLFLHFSWVLQGNVMIPTPAVWALTLFVLVFTVAIAIFKDVPDMKGDKQYNINTFTIRLGKQTVFNLARWVITACYVGIILAGVLLLSAVNPLFLGITHLAALILLWWRSQSVDLQDKGAIASFYQFIWKLFFLEYLIFPAACLLA
ncbi:MULTISPECIES: homogentisate phytyltransferase [unclassified Coleofasciculus]|uniref:homogentisate phytyltransferase n=1 Tax=unclassified Coleofasciculus TaxID=2692782 RepID=UPI00187E3F7F|nr:MULTISPECIES: homogentisate phytyltransferase [unclassified Coleofasciculus]MBE9127608.1 homogentisate phytyltransferase [Coleofasciculus sp. LEGE 07081]MBE9150921.1 homogentisate phytyltransferase [Coleofasciculus sp. LEGE 07092]